MRSTPGEGRAVEDVANHADQGFRGVGFAQEILNRVPEWIGNLQAADHDDLDGRIEVFERFNGRRAVHDGHHHVGKHDVNLLRLLGVERNRLSSFSGGDSTVTEGLECALRDVADRELVVDHKHEFVAATREFDLKGRCGRSPERRVGGQVDPERRASTNFAVNMDETTMGFDDGVYRRETEACAFANFLGCKEWFENAFTNCLWYTQPGVAYLDHHVPSCANFPAGAKVQGLESDVDHAQREGAAVRHGVAGVDGEIEQHLMKLGGVTGYGPKIIGDPRHNFDITGESIVDD